MTRDKAVEITRLLNDIEDFELSMDQISAKTGVTNPGYLIKERRV